MSLGSLVASLLASLRGPLGVSLELSYGLPENLLGEPQDAPRTAGSQGFSGSPATAKARR
jgi:hypothetical protein|tara:strand:+ start:140 stop:319 length:180 start_codon:yes stop_codon:yes gene_type:complete